MISYDGELTLGPVRQSAVVPVPIPSDELPDAPDVCAIDIPFTALSLAEPTCHNVRRRPA